MACLDDAEEDGAHVEQEEHEFAPEDVPATRDGTFLSVDTGYEHGASHITTQRLGLRVAVDTMTSHVYRPSDKQAQQQSQY